MNRIRVGCIITALLGVMYAGAGLFDSLMAVAVGMIVAAVAVIGYGLCDWLEHHVYDRRMARERDAVWARRDAEASRGL